MSNEIEELEYIYQNTKIAIENIARIIKIRRKNDKLNLLFKEQLKGYYKIINSCKGMLNRRKKEAKDISIMSKIVSYFSININNEKDNPDIEFVNLLINDGNIRINQLNKHFKESGCKSKTIENLNSRLVYLEQKFVNLLKNM